MFLLGFLHAAKPCPVAAKPVVNSQGYSRSIGWGVWIGVPMYIAHLSEAELINSI